MKKYEDLKLLESIKQWVLDSERSSVNSLARDIAYGDFNKFGKYLLKINDVEPAERPRMIEAFGTNLENSQLRITKKCFVTIANYVFDVPPAKPLELQVYLPTHADLWSGLSSLAQVVNDPIALAENVECLKKDFIETRAKLNQSNLESVLLAGMVIHICTLLTEKGGVEENLTKSVCMPILAMLGLPESASSVSRFRAEFDLFIKEFSHDPEPEVPFNDDWNDWWEKFRAQVESACRTDTMRFSLCANQIRRLPGAKNLLPEIEDQVQVSDIEAPRKITQEEKLQERIKRFNTLKPAARKKLIRKTLDQALFEFEFLAKAEDESGQYSLEFVDLKKAVHELSLKFN